ncbi:MAG: S8 family peptidase, partial [Thermoleophilia bacterium]
MKYSLSRLLQTANHSRAKFLFISGAFLFSLMLPFAISRVNASPAASKHQAEVQPSILDKLQQSNEVSVIVTLDDSMPEEARVSPADDLDTKRNKLEKKKGAVHSRQQDTLSGLDAQDFKVKHQYQTFSSIAGSVTQSGLNKLRNNPNVVRIDEDFQVHTTLNESRGLIRANEAQAASYTGAGQVVAVIDTGVDYGHPDLGGCYGPACKVLGGWDIVNNDPYPMDDSVNSHGTHVAGIIAANGGARGVAPGASLLAFKVCDSGGNCDWSNVEAGIDATTNWSIANGRSVTINISLGGGSNSTPCWDAGMQTAYDNGIFMAVASGNDGYGDSISFPACVTTAFSVGAVYDANLGNQAWSGCTDSSTAANQITCFTNRGALLDILAPGAQITSTVRNGSYGNLGGTSMAAPHVAGIAALLHQLEPNVRPQEIDRALKAGGRSINGYPWLMADAIGAINALGSPFGNFESVTRAVGGARVMGWAIDGDTNEAIDVHFYANNVGVGIATANINRPDVGSAQPSYGSLHGFDTNLTLGAGSNNVCAYAISKSGTPGTNQLLGCRTIIVDGNPFGTFDSVTRAPGGARVAGWTIDADTANYTQVHVYSNGVFAGSANANTTRADVGSTYPSYGSLHGYSTIVNLSPGNNNVCTYGINAAGTPGTNTTLGCRAINIDANPTGALDSVTRVPGGVKARGWTLDRDSASSIDVHFYVDGVGAGAATANAVRPDLSQAYPD